MKRNIRRLFIFFLLVIIGAVIFFPYNQYAGDLKTMLEKEARDRGIILEIESMKFGFPARIAATGIAALLPQGKFNIPLWINSVDVIPELWPLVSRKVIASLEGKAYDGDLAGALDWSAKTGSGTVRLGAANLQIEKHPLFQPYNATGIASFNFQSGLNLITAAPGTGALLQPVGAKLDLSIEKGNIPSQKNFGLFSIPAVSDFNLRTRLEQIEQTINIKSFKVDSSLGKVEASGTVHLTGRGNFDNSRITGTIDLTEAGWTIYGPQLLMFSGRQSQQPIYSWSIAIDYSAGGFPNIKLLPQP